MRKLFLLLCFIGVSVWHLSAQTLSIDTANSILFPVSCDSGSTQQLYFYINYAGSSLGGKDTFTVNYRVKNNPLDSSVHTFSEFSVKDSLNTSDTTTIQVANFKINAANGFFVSDDIVVIWPTGSGGFPFTCDSIFDTVNVHHVSGLPALNRSLTVSVYPNPANEVLYINYDERAIDLKQVKINDLLGRTLLTKNSSFKTIDINSLPEGFYFLEAITTDKSRFVSQFTKLQ